MDQVTNKLFRLIDFALQRARQEEVVEYQTLWVFLSLLTKVASDPREFGTGWVRCMRRCGWHQGSDHRITRDERRQLTCARSKAQAGIWTGAAMSIDTCAPRSQCFARTNEHDLDLDGVGRRCPREPRRLLRTNVILLVSVYDPVLVLATRLTIDT